MNSNELEKGEINMDTPKVFESEYRFCLILCEQLIARQKLINRYAEKSSQSF